MAHPTAGQYARPMLQPSISSENRAVEFRFNFDTETVDVNGQRVRLTQKEYELLELLWTHKGVTLSEQMILNHLYGGTYEPGQKVIDVFICRIRKKLQAITGDDPIKTVWGRGYMLADQNRANPMRKNPARDRGLMRLPDQAHGGGPRKPYPMRTKASNI